MRIKLSKQHWRLVGQKMGWLKRAQIETTTAAGAKSTGAAEAMGLDKEKGNYDAMETNDAVRGREDNGIDYNNSDPGGHRNDRPNIKLHQGLLTDVQVEQLSQIDYAIEKLFQFIDATEWTNKNYMETVFGSTLRDEYGNRSGPITAESFEATLEGTSRRIQRYIQRGLNRNAEKTSDTPQDKGRIIQNLYTPAQLQRFEKAGAERLQKLESIKPLIRNAFRTYMAGKPQIQNTGGLDFTGNVKL